MYSRQRTIASGVLAATLLLLAPETAESRRGLVQTLKRQAHRIKVRHQERKAFNQLLRQEPNAKAIYKVEKKRYHTGTNRVLKWWNLSGGVVNLGLGTGLAAAGNPFGLVNLSVGALGVSMGRDVGKQLRKDITKARMTTLHSLVKNGQAIDNPVLQKFYRRQRIKGIRSARRSMERGQAKLADLLGSASTPGAAAKPVAEPVSSSNLPVAAQNHLPAVVEKRSNLPAVVEKRSNLPAVVEKRSNLPAVVEKRSNLPAILAPIDLAAQAARSRAGASARVKRQRSSDPAIKARANAQLSKMGLGRGDLNSLRGLGVAFDGKKGDFVFRKGSAGKWDVGSHGAVSKDGRYRYIAAREVGGHKVPGFVEKLSSPAEVQPGKAPEPQLKYATLQKYVSRSLHAQAKGNIYLKGKDFRVTGMELNPNKITFKNGVKYVGWTAKVDVKGESGYRANGWIARDRADRGVERVIVNSTTPTPGSIVN
jgi:hypothetical protein